MSEDEKMQFKAPKRKNIRQRRRSSDEEVAEYKEDDREIQSKLELIHETKEKQKLRNRTKGVNV